MFQLIFPWYVRFGIDIILVTAPFIYLNSNKNLNQDIQLPIYFNILKTNVVFREEEVYLLLFRSWNPKQIEWWEIKSNFYSSWSSSTLLIFRYEVWMIIINSNHINIILYKIKTNWSLNEIHWELFWSSIHIVDM